VRKLVLAGLAVLAALFTGLLGGTVPAIGVQFPTIRPLQAVRPGITVSLYALGFNQTSCSSASACLGIGLAVNPKTLGSQVTLAWKGSAWRKLALPIPAKGAMAVELTGVSCAREVKQPSCVAVGDYVSKSGDSSVFAVAWTGGALRLLPVPRLPKGVADVYFDGLSCVSARHCVALGVGIATSNGAFPLLFETWDGTGWTVKTKDLPTVDDFPDLNGISCATPTYCVLVGGLQQGGNDKQNAYAARWNGTSLSRLTVPVPAGIAAPSLAAVSCSSTAFCAVTALNFSATSGPTGTAFTDILRDGNWSLAKVAWPKGTKTSQLLTLSCLSPTWCIAAGNVGSRVAAFTYNGRSWSSQHLPAPAQGYADDFGGITCVTEKSCIALGDIGPVKENELEPLGALWNGKTWSLKVI
jgi:hypothetical protein